MAVQYTNIFHSKVPKIYPYCDFWFENKPSGNPALLNGIHIVISFQVGRNICHGSDSVESAKKEINLWFKAEELVSWTPAGVSWVYED
jgi:hypothetical protein